MGQNCILTSIVKVLVMKRFHSISNNTSYQTGNSTALNNNYKTGFLQHSL